MENIESRYEDSCAYFAISKKGDAPAYQKTMQWSKRASEMRSSDGPICRILKLRKKLTVADILVGGCDIDSTIIFTNDIYAYNMFSFDLSDFSGCKTGKRVEIDGNSDTDELFYDPEEDAALCPKDGYFVIDTGSIDSDKSSKGTVFVACGCSAHLINSKTSQKLQLFYSSISVNSKMMIPMRIMKACDVVLKKNEMIDISKYVDSGTKINRPETSCDLEITCDLGDAIGGHGHDMTFTATTRYITGKDAIVMYEKAAKVAKSAAMSGVTQEQLLADYLSE